MANMADPNQTAPLDFLAVVTLSKLYLVVDTRQKDSEDKQRKQKKIAGRKNEETMT